MKTINLIIVVLAVVAALSHEAEAILYTVGDKLGWAIPPGGAATYAKWAGQHSFVLYDELYFNFAEGEQDLAYVTMEDYMSCNTKDPLYLSQEPVTLEFTATGLFHFTSTLGGHCEKGQKIAIYIGEVPSPSPAPSPCPYSTFAEGGDENALSAPFVAHKINTYNKSN